MSRIVVRQQFKHAYGGVNVRTVAVGTVLAEDDEATPAALAEGWAEREQARREQTAAVAERNTQDATEKRGRKRQTGKG